MFLLETKHILNQGGGEQKKYSLVFLKNICKICIQIKTKHEDIPYSPFDCPFEF